MYLIGRERNETPLSPEFRRWRGACRIGVPVHESDKSPPVDRYLHGKVLLGSFILKDHIIVPLPSCVFTLLWSELTRT